MSEIRPLDSVSVFCGESNHHVAQVYCSLSEAIPLRAELRGTIRGPMSRLAHTLPATADIEFLGADPAPLARATVVDPCYWAAGRPFLYDVDLDLMVEGQVIDNVRRLVGLRPTGVIGHELRVSLKPWFVRGVSASRMALEGADRWRRDGLSLVSSDPGDVDLRQTSHEGIPVMMKLTGDEAGLRAAIRQYSAWPSCVVALLEANVSLDPTIRNLAPNVLFAQQVQPEDSKIDAWADVGVLESALDVELALPTNGDYPIILSTHAEQYDDLSQAASVIDRISKRAEDERRVVGVIV